MKRGDTGGFGLKERGRITTWIDREHDVTLARIL